MLLLTLRHLSFLLLFLVISCFSQSKMNFCLVTDNKIYLPNLYHSLHSSLLFFPSPLMDLAMDRNICPDRSDTVLWFLYTPWISFSAGVCVAEWVLVSVSICAWDSSSAHLKRNRTDNPATSKPQFANSCNAAVSGVWPHSISKLKPFKKQSCWIKRKRGVNTLEIP